MGGLAFMINDKMCVGIVGDDLMARVGKEKYHDALTMDGVRKMDFTGKAMKGYVFVNYETTANDNNLNYWLDMALAFNEALTSK